MPTYQRTEAYDLSLFEERPRRKPAPQLVNKIQERKRAVSVKKTVFSIIVCIALMFAGCTGLLVTRAESVRVEQLIARQKNEIYIAKSENVRLKSEMGTKMSPMNIANYAENEMGMIKTDAVFISYINTCSDGGVVLYTPRNSLLHRDNQKGDS